MPVAPDSSVVATMGNFSSYDPTVYNENTESHSCSFAVGRPVGTEVVGMEGRELDMANMVMVVVVAVMLVVDF